MPTLQTVLYVVVLAVTLACVDYAAVWLAMTGSPVLGTVLYIGGFAGGMTTTFHVLPTRAAFAVLILGALLSALLLRPQLRRLLALPKGKRFESADAAR